MTRDREDFRVDYGDGGSSYDRERDSDEPGYDPGPDEEDLPDDPEVITHRLDELYGRQQSIHEDIVELENKLMVIQEEINDLEARLEQVPEEDE